MAKPSLYDDPVQLQRFLQVLRNTSGKSEQPVNSPSSKFDPLSPDFSPKPTVTESRVENGLSKPSDSPQGVQLSHQQGPAASRLAPFHSPFPQPSLTQKTARVDLIQNQNGSVTEPATSAVEEMHFQNQPNLPAAAAANKRPLTPTQHRLLVGKKPGIEHLTEDKLAEFSKQTQGYMDTVVDRFRMSKEQDAAQDSVASDHVSSARLQATPSPYVRSSLPTDGDREPNPGFLKASSTDGPDGTAVKSLSISSQNDEPRKSPGQQEDWQEKSPDRASFHTPVVNSACKNDQQWRNDSSKQGNDSPEVIPFPNFTERPLPETLRNVNGDGEGEQGPTSVAAVKDKPLPASTLDPQAPSTVKEDSGEESVTVIHNANESDSPLPQTRSPTIVVTAITDTEDSVKEDNDDDEKQEDRENLVRFKSWGKPPARNKPKSRARTAILTGLPRGADFTLVQSLIHGGAIESMRLIATNPERITIAAHVTFTSPDACDRYCDEYPKGIEARYQGRKWSVLVHKKEQVDVISGMLQGYLDCGATRVVKVSGADEDWGIVALNKLAEGKAGTRQVEAVQDMYHNGIRTIVFRFANISHAVQFKSYLIRSDDWYGCHVEFSEDPCEKATGIRND